MSTNLISSGTTAREKVNLRTPDVMAAVQQQVESHYRSDIVEKVRRAGGTISVGDTTVRLAKQFGFCYGVERAIDLAYAARKVFKDRQLLLSAKSFITRGQSSDRVTGHKATLPAKTRRLTFPISARKTSLSSRRSEPNYRSSNRSRIAAARLSIPHAET